MVIKNFIRKKSYCFKLIFLDSLSFYFKKRIDQNLKSFFLSFLKALFFQFLNLFTRGLNSMFTVLAVMLCVFLKFLFFYYHSKEKLDIISYQVLFNVFSITNDFTRQKVQK